MQSRTGKEKHSRGNDDLLMDFCAPFDRVRAGDHSFLRILRHIIPLVLIFGWKIRVTKLIYNKQIDNRRIIQWREINRWRIKRISFGKNNIQKENSTFIIASNLKQRSNMRIMSIVYLTGPIIVAFHLYTSYGIKINFMNYSGICIKISYYLTRLLGQRCIVPVGCI